MPSEDYNQGFNDGVFKTVIFGVVSYITYNAIYYTAAGSKYIYNVLTMYDGIEKEQDREVAGSTTAHPHDE